MSKTYLSVRIETNQKEKLERISETLGVDISYIIRELIENLADPIFGQDFYKELRVGWMLWERLPFDKQLPILATLCDIDYGKLTKDLLYNSPTGVEHLPVPKADTLPFDSLVRIINAICLVKRHQKGN